MPRASNIPRRAWQRRTLGQKRPSSQPTHKSEERPAKRTRIVPTSTRLRYVHHSDNEDLFSSSGSDTESECSEGYEGPRLFSQRATEERRRGIKPNSADPSLGDLDIDKLSESEAGFDSGYHSLDEDPDDKADYYDELLERFRADGPTLANHGENTEKMEKEQGEKWDK